MTYPFIASPNFNIRKLPVDMLVFHFTASGSVTSTVNWFKNPDANASSHYVLGQDGEVVQMVYLKDRAWHAGRSEWEGTTDINSCSIGIEIVNWGKLEAKGEFYCCWPNNYGKIYSGPVFKAEDGTFWAEYTDIQIKNCIRLGRELVEKFEIPKDRILGHSDIAPGRKTDPGPAFPIAEVLEGIYPTVSLRDDLDELKVSELLDRQGDRSDSKKKKDPEVITVAVCELPRLKEESEIIKTRTFCEWFRDTFGGKNVEKDL